tara:strand:+ start:1793 stop:3658 length:1866 start_codon:yes stop_codon:yes gene_type:complete
MLSLQQLSLRRQAKMLVEDASLTIYAGFKVGLVGANGSGKTSLFKLILGELDADQGRLEIPPSLRIAHMAQEVPASSMTAVDYVLSGDTSLQKVSEKIAVAEAKNDYTTISALYEQYADLDGYTARSRAEQLLVGLGFSESNFEQSLSVFSGGWRVRLNLARTLMAPCELLLLDEPTNHLDLDAIFWLSAWLSKFEGTLIIISHDRDFLDDCTTHTAFLHNQTLHFHSGNYSAFERIRSQQLEDQAKQYSKQQRAIAHMEDYVRRFRYKATKAKQAQSRLKAIERMAKVAPVHEASPFRFEFPHAAKVSDPLLRLDDASIGYGEPLVERIRFTLSPGDRVGLLGVNGAGKTTLIKTLIGILPMLAGERLEGHHLQVGYFSQHQVDDLNLEQSPLAQLSQLNPMADELALRKFLGGFNFQGDRAHELPSSFSGGEKARLALALVAFLEPNVLLFDEPTNHLDMEMRQALANAMNAFPGAILLISHDRFLLKSTVEQFVKIEEGRLIPFEQDLDDYKGLLTQPKALSEAAPMNEPVTPSSQKRNHREVRQLETRMKTLMERIDRLSGKLKEVENALSDPALYADSDHPDLQQLLRNQLGLTEEIAEKEAEWLELSSQVENLAG